MNLVYLKPNVQIEPLVNQWHAHPFLLAPATAAMIVANYQLNVMNSYIKMPAAHAAALENPDMVGGPFIDYKGERVDEIRVLRDQLTERSENLIQLANGIKSFNNILKDKKDGLPLEELYSSIPEQLRGYVELVYDLQHRPDFRFIEALLYKSFHLNAQAHSIALTLIEQDNRPFIFSTPRLPNKNSVHLPLSLKSPLIDLLDKLRNRPLELQEVEEKLQVHDQDKETFRTFFTDTPPSASNASFDKDGIRIRYFGHACVLIQTAQTTILTDPLISYNYDSPIKRYTYEDLPEEIDYVVITHNHHDHIVLETLLQLRGRIKNIIVPRAGTGYLQDPSMKLVLQNLGFASVSELDELEKVTLKDGEILTLPFFGEHCDLAIRTKLTYLIKLRNTTIFITADSSCLNPSVYENIHRITGDIDYLYIGMECTGAPMSWSYGSLFSTNLDRQLDQKRRSKGSDCDKAMKIVNIFNVRHAFLYATGSEPWLTYFMALQHSHSNATESESIKFVDQCREQGVAAEILFGHKEIVIS